MTADQQRRARDLFEAALDLEASRVSQWLREAASDDPVVFEEVRSLLDHHTRAGRFLTEPISETAPHLLDQSPALRPGTVISTYTIVREIGRGGMGRVYLASDARLGRVVALKALAPELTREPHHRERLRREARAAALLTHPGICTVYALEELDGEVYIVSEYVEGHTLREEIAGGIRPSDELIASTARELASALASAHARGVTHGDLKPDNIMRTPDGRIKILDFGLARVEGAVGMGALTITMPGAVAGTPAYMAPEQIEGKRGGPAADVFSFGVLMYEWASGRHPFQAGSVLAVLARVMESTPDPLAEHAPVSDAFSEVIARCLRKTAAERFVSASEVLDALTRQPTGRIAIRPARRTGWWRTHQIIAIGLYVFACAHAWQIKEWLRTVDALHASIGVWVFLLMGIAGSVGGIVRGHLVFTDVMNQSRLRAELERTFKVRLFSDLSIATLLVVDGLLLTTWPLTAVLTVSLATGIALAAVLMEPATTTALLGDSRA